MVGAGVPGRGHLHPGRAPDARYDRQRRLIGELLSALPCLPLDEAAADRAAAVRHTLVADGIAIYDRERVARDFASEWERVFFDKLCRDQQHPDTIRLLESAQGP